MSKLKVYQASSDLIMKAVIFCDHFAFVAKVNGLLQRIGERPDVSGGWTTKSLPVNALNQTDMADKILAEALDAHLVVIPTRRACALPTSLRDWLERWATVRQIKDAALAMIDDGIYTNLTKTVSPELTAMVREHGLHFVTGEDASATDTKAVIERFLPEFRPALPAVDSRFADAAAYPSFRGVGIND